MTTGEQLAGGEWLEQACEHLGAITPGLQGEVRRQQAALALMQAGREGAACAQLEGTLQACALRQLHQAIKELGG
jgi:hypothetical protein